jgi:hypothetical protein
MPNLNTEPKKSRIKKMRIHEVSLAGNPMNGFPYLTIKEGGILMPTAIHKLVASLALKSKEISEVVKEELKAIASSDISVKDFLDAMRELGLKESDLVPDGKALVAKDEIVNKETHDIVLKGSWEAKKTDKYAQLDPEVRKELDAQKATIKELQLTNLTASLTNQVGEAVAKEIVPFYGKLEEKEATALVALISAQQKMIKDLGGSIGKVVKEETNVVTKETMQTEVEKIAKEEKISQTDAMIRWAERNPERQAQLS